MTQRFDPVRHHRRSIRLRGYDYARPGVYFITICTHDRGSPFGKIVNGVMRPNDAGMAAQTMWHAIPTHFPHVRLDAFVVMPNHVHGVVVITSDAIPNPRAVGATHASPLPNPTSHPDPASHPNPTSHPDPASRPDHGSPRPIHAPPRPHAPTTPSPRPVGPPPCSISAIVGSYKSAVSRRINQMRNTPGAPFWQRDYYERILRDDASLQCVRAYIEANPRRWCIARTRYQVDRSPR